MPKTPRQTLVDSSQDPGLNYLTSQDSAAVANQGGRRVVSTDSGNFVSTIQPINQVVYNFIENTNGSGASGVTGDLQFNNNGQLSSDPELTYDPNADALTVSTITVTTHAELGSPSHVKISGGVSGQALTTDGLGNLTWATITGGGGTSDYNQLTNKPALFSGNYADLTNKPTIPSVTGLASETFVNLAVANLVNSAPSALNTLNELATALGNDASFSTTITNTLANKVSIGAFTWSNLSGKPSLFDSTAQLHLTSTAESSSASTGALIVDGGVGINGNINADGTKHKFNGNLHITGVDSSSLYIGAYADVQSLTAPVLVAKDSYDTFVQAALINSSQFGSSDWVAYSNQGTDVEGWSDMGMTGSNFSDINYSITHANDGYFFVQGLTGQGGNMVLATGNKGGSTHRDIVFATGGFLVENERMRLNHEDTTLYVGGHAESGGTNVTNLDVNGNVTFRSKATLGSVGNVKISGGTTGQVLSTDGTGNLSWVAQSGGGGSTGNITFSGDIVGSIGDSITVAGSSQVLMSAVEGASQIWAQADEASIFVNGSQWRFTTPTVAGLTSNAFEYPNGVTQRSGDYVNCLPNADTVIYTAATSFNNTVKLLINIEGIEDGQTVSDTQSCEMIVAKGARNDSVAGSAYGLVYTSANPLVTLATRWNSVDGRIEVVCRPASTTNSVSVHCAGLEVASASAP